MKLRHLKYLAIPALMVPAFLYLNWTPSCPSGQVAYRDTCLPSVKSISGDSFYKKQIVYNNHAVRGTQYLPNKALQEAAYIVKRMTEKSPALLTWLNNNGIKSTIIRMEVEHTLDVPEFASLPYGEVFPHKDDPNRWWFERRGLGANIERKTTLGSEENILCKADLTGPLPITYPPQNRIWPYQDQWRDAIGDTHKSESIFIHEFAHTIHLAIKRSNATLNKKINDAYARVVNNKTPNVLWYGTYASKHVDEYFAEASQSWFSSNKRIPSDKTLWGDHNKVWNREELYKHDLVMYNIMKEVYGTWTWKCP